jgi:hypothetical protein
MPVRVRCKIEVAISSTSLEERDLCNLRREFVSDRLGEGGSWKMLLAASAVDVSIPLDSVADVNLFGIIATPKDPNQDPQDILIRFNSITGEQRTISSLSDCKEGLALLSTAGITSLFASNPGAADMEIILIVAGD